MSAHVFKKAVPLAGSPSLRATPPHELNDPNDCSYSPGTRRIDYSDPDKPKIFEVQDESDASDIAPGPLTQVNERPVGLICLTESYKNILMWSHYGNFGQGFVVGYETKGLNKAAEGRSLKPLTAVHYSNIRPKWDLNPPWEEILYRKHIDWSYETEWRLVCFLHELKSNEEKLPIGQSSTRTIHTLGLDGSSVRKVYYFPLDMGQDSLNYVESLQRSESYPQLDFCPLKRNPYRFEYDELNPNRND